MKGTNKRQREQTDNGAPSREGRAGPSGASEQGTFKLRPEGRAGAGPAERGPRGTPGRSGPPHRAARGTEAGVAVAGAAGGDSGVGGREKPWYPRASLKGMSWDA